MVLVLSDPHCLGLGLALTVLVLCLETKTPVEKRQLPTDSPETKLAKYLTMIKREDVDPDE